MNILIPDSWLRDFLKTKATPKQVAECLSLSGPSIERVIDVNGEAVYDVEITTNRVDAMSVVGIAREAAAILPEFHIPARFVPPTIPATAAIQGTKPLGVTIKNDPKLCRRIVAIKLEDVHLGQSPKWMKERLIAVGQRPLNNIIDITNYVMWEMGHPIHAFDWDRLSQKMIIVREAKKGEHLTTLDGKKCVLKGGEIIFDDGTGIVIDLPGIMGTANTVISEYTKNVMLFIENSDPAKIRQASMGLAVRTQAAVVNEKDPDPELVLPSLLRATALAKELAHARVASKLVDIYPHPQEAKPVYLSQKRLDTYMGFSLEGKRVKRILENLGCSVTIKNSNYVVTAPTWRINDLMIPEDIIEEIARIYGYHNIATKLPDRELPIVMPPKELSWEEEVKVRLRDWGYTELYTYSMISEELMDIFDLDKKKAYKISNPLSNEWVYMRPNILPSVLSAFAQNLKLRENLKMFELSMIYEYRTNDLPLEIPILTVLWSGDQFRQAKGLAEALFALFGIDFEAAVLEKHAHQHAWYTEKSATAGPYCSFGVLAPDVLARLHINQPITRLFVNFGEMVQRANPTHTFHPIPKYPPIVEDLSFTVITGTKTGDMIAALSKQHPLIASVVLLDSYKHNRTFRITYLDRNKTLTDSDVKPIREKLIRVAEEKFSATLLRA
jgi:phenylalanyl-tRNA synthetase beta chain